MQLRGLGERCRLPSGVWAEPQPKSNLVHFGCKIWHLVATVLIIFLRINLPNFVQFKQYRGKSGPRVLLFKARFFTTVNINSKHWYLNGEKQKCRLKFATRKKITTPQLFPGSILLPPSCHRNWRPRYRGRWRQFTPTVISLSSSDVQRAVSHLPRRYFVYLQLTCSSLVLNRGGIPALLKPPA